MKEETSEHVRHAILAFLWIVFPSSLAYLLGYQFLLRQNVLGPMLWGMGVYFYSNFLPDIPSIYRKKSSPDSVDLPWYKKYAILLFAPLLIWLLFSDIRLSWKTAETYHNFRSLAIYGTFLFVTGFLGFAGIPLSVDGIVTVVFFQSCGIVGYLTHLKVDEIW
jgi:hypothetical protein